MVKFRIQQKQLKKRHFTCTIVIKHFIHKINANILNAQSNVFLKYLNCNLNKIIVCRNLTNWFV